MLTTASGLGGLGRPGGAADQSGQPGRRRCPRAARPPRRRWWRGPRSTSTAPSGRALGAEQPLGLAGDLDEQRCLDGDAAGGPRASQSWTTAPSPTVSSSGRGRPESSPASMADGVGHLLGEGDDVLGHGARVLRCRGARPRRAVWIRRLALAPADEDPAARRLRGGVHAGEELALAAVAGHEQRGGAGLAQALVSSGSYRPREAPATRRVRMKCRPMSWPRRGCRAGTGRAAAGRRW